MGDMRCVMEQAKLLTAISQISHLTSHIYNRNDCFEARVPPAKEFFLACFLKCQIFKTGVLSKKGEFGPPRRPVALFADDYLRSALFGAIGVVNFIAVDKCDHISIRSSIPHFRRGK